MSDKINLLDQLFDVKEEDVKDKMEEGEISISMGNMPELAMEGTEPNIQDVLNALNAGGRQYTQGERPRIRRQRRGNRMKVFDQGYIFTYDKDSSCGQRSFWRCERKNDCPARVHTNPLTNQVIKRIHHHTHEPPAREDLPPWLVFNEEEGAETAIQDQSVLYATVAPTTPQSTSTTTTTHMSASTSSAASLQSNTGSMFAYSPLMATKVETDEEKNPIVIPARSEMDLLERSGITVEPPKKKARKYGSKKEEMMDMVEQFVTQPNEFWEIFDASRKLYNWAKTGKSMRPVHHGYDQRLCNPAVAELLDAHNLSEYKSPLAKHTMDILRHLSSDDLIRAMGHEADGILLYHVLRAQQKPQTTVGDGSDTTLKVYIAEEEEEESEAIFQLITLHQRTLTELRSILTSKGLLEWDKVRMCVPGPPGTRISVELSDEMITAWEPNSVFVLGVTKGVYILKRINL